MESSHDMRNVLVSGGAGFIGSYLVTALASQSYKVTVLDNFSTQVHGDVKVPAHQHANIRIVRGDVRSRQDWLQALKDQHVVIHLAAETGTGQSMYRIERYVDVNVRGTAALLDILANERHSVRKILVASSRAIYGEGKYRCEEHGIVYPSGRSETDMGAGDFRVKCPVCRAAASLEATDEDSKIQPTSIYGISKQCQEQLFMTAGRSLGIPAVALRYQNVFGPGQSLQNPYTGILSIFTTRIRNGLPIFIFEDGKESRDFVYIDDVTQATLRAMQDDASDFEIFNVGSGARTDVLNVAHQLRAVLDGKNSIEINRKFRVGDIRDNLADISKIRSRLGFAPAVSFEEGIRRFGTWAATQPLYRDRLDESIGEMQQRGLYK